MRFWVIFGIVLATLVARENPFLPTDINATSVISANTISKAPAFEPVEVAFDSDMRELLSVSFTYKSIDGSIKEKVVDINASLNWQEPLLIGAAASEPHKTYIPARLDEVPPLGRERFKNLIEFRFYESHIDLLTRSELIRDFVIAKPDKIVIDFRHPKPTFASKSFAARYGVATDISIGAHDGFYRVVISLNGKYRHAIRTIGEGYRIVLR